MLFGLAKIVKLGFTSKKYGDYIIYDKFFLILRNVCLSNEEIITIKKNYRFDNPEMEEP